MTNDASPLVPAGNADKPFWQWLEKNEFRLPRCASCRTWQWPALWRCPQCGGFDNEWLRVAACGTVFSWTRTHYPFVPARADELPFVVVLTELADAGRARVLGILEGSSEDIAIGRAVVGRIEPASPRSGGLPSVVWRLDAGAGGAPV
jgi:uncharacterized OB-fold protein